MYKKRLTSLLKIAVSLVLLAAVLAFTGWREVLARLGEAQAGWLAAALGAYLAGVLVRALRWQILLRGLGARGIGIPRLVGLYFVSFFFNSFLPTGIGGDVMRIAEVARARCLPGAGGCEPGEVVGAARAASSVVADRAVGLVATSVLALLALPFAGTGVPWPIVAIAAVTAIGVPAGFALVAGHGARPERSEGAAGLAWLGRRVPWLRRLTGHRRVRETAAAFTAYRPRDLAIAAGISLLFSVINAVTYACIGLALDIALPLAYYMLASPIVTLVLLVPISFNGLGTRDGAYLLLFVPAGVTRDGALAMSLMYHAVNYITAIAGGVIYAGMGTAESLADGGRQ